jgi:hypothetical protein
MDCGYDLDVDVPEDGEVRLTIERRPNQLALTAHADAGLSDQVSA